MVNNSLPWKILVHVYIPFQVKGIMVQNIESVLERGENLDDLMQTTEDLQAHVSP